MPNTILLVEPCLDSLAKLAGELRDRGFEVILAETIDDACLRRPAANLSAILLADSLLAQPGAEATLAADPVLNRTARWVLTDTNPPTQDTAHLPKHDPDAIAKRLLLHPSARLPPPVPDRGDLRGDLQQVGIPDLLQLLTSNRRTGTLAIVTVEGQGEVRLVDGEIVDAVFRRVEGTKALFRLFAEAIGTFSFLSGSPTPLRRVTETTQVLLLEGVRHTDESRRILTALGATQDALQATRPPNAEDTELNHTILLTLQVPKTANELLDELPSDDLTILNAVQSLAASGLVRRIPRGALSVDLAEPDQLSLLSAIIRQLKRPGFQGNPRIIVFSTPAKLSACQHALSRITDSLPPTDNNRATLVALRLATLRLADSQELDVFGVPTSHAYCPLWNLTLPGSAAIILLNTERSELLEEAATLSGVPLFDAETLVGQIDEGDPRQVAALVRATLESAAGR